MEGRRQKETIKGVATKGRFSAYAAGAASVPVRLDYAEKKFNIFADGRDIHFGL